MEVVQSKTDTSNEAPDLTITNEVKFVKFTQSTYGLNRNGQNMVCPHINPTIKQRVVEPKTSITTMEGQKQPTVEVFEVPKPCNSNCPLFQFEHKNDKIIVDICCGSTPIHYTITEILAK